MNKRKTSFILATALAASIIMSGCASTAVSGSDSSSTATEESATVETALDIDYSVGLKKGRSLCWCQGQEYCYSSG